MPKVLATIDGSEEAASALHAAVELFGPDADYVLLSVVPPWSPAVAMAVNEELGVPAGTATGSGGTHGAAGGTNPYTPTPASVAATTQALYDYFRTAQRQAATRAGITAEHLIEEAKPRKRRIGNAICEAAADRGVDVVVLGAHGSSHTGEVLLGSVSQYVLHNAPCPVLVDRSG